MSTQSKRQWLEPADRSTLGDFIARRLVFCDRGLKATNAAFRVLHDRPYAPNEPLPPPLDPTDYVPNGAMQEQLRRWARGDDFRIIIDRDVRSYGFCQA